MPPFPSVQISLELQWRRNFLVTLQT
ncbi:hypothetical protein Celaphus_00003631 [Cervus elaphus hippelaphus]|uniref:Uncharacterized protein n=1 Tax=Cervus elaphus hippelaphus TaxID=46360 RepID=A0A212D1R7_CEREH|nr:hypothetical protein Celaphus_00003631 [Cervus elaphus hippelaphus]